MAYISCERLLFGASRVAPCIGAAASTKIPICSTTPATKAITGHLLQTLAAATPTTSTSTAPPTSVRTTTIGRTAAPFAAFTVPDLHFHIKPPVITPTAPYPHSKKLAP